jgi:hypothetical protein
MLANNLRGRFDRLLLRPSPGAVVGWRAAAARLVGTHALPGVTHTSARGRQLAVLPSDHYGLLVELASGTASHGR